VTTAVGTAPTRGCVRALTAGAPSARFCLPRSARAARPGYRGFRIRLVARLASSLQRPRSMMTPQDVLVTLAECFETLGAAPLARVSGGYSPQLFSAMQQAVNMGLTINSTTTGGHAPNSMHYKGRAFDAIGTPAQMQGFYNWAASNTHPHELIHKNQFLKDGHAHAPIGGHNGHVHFSI
jgi:hypothetical protein